MNATAAPPDSPSPPAAGGEEVLHFEHPFFAKIEGTYFRLSEQTDEPVFVIKFDESEAALPLPGIMREFDIAPDSPDGQMLALVVEGLKYVKILQPGQPIPKEVLTGEISWEVEERHRQIAFHRLSLQILSWISGERVPVTDPAAIMDLADDPQTRKEINEAFAAAAEQLGLGREHREEVIGYVERLAEELAHVEALRDIHREQLAMAEKIKKLFEIYEQETVGRDIAGPVADLMNAAIADFKTPFKTAATLTADILEVLKSLDVRIEEIKSFRNELYRRLLAWNEILTVWRGATVEKSRENVDRLNKTYRFLAPRYMRVEEWVLAGQLQMPKTPAPAPSPKKPPGGKARRSEMVW